MRKRTKIIMFTLLFILLIFPFLLFIFYRNKIKWGEDFNTILMGTLTYLATIILAFVANMIAISSQTQVEINRAKEQEVKNYEKENERLLNNIKLINKCIRNFDNRIFEYFTNNYICYNYKEMIDIVNDGLNRIDCFLLDLEQIDDYNCIDVHCTKCNKKCKYDEEFKKFLLFFKNKTKEFIDLHMNSIGLMQEILMKNEINRIPGSSIYFDNDFKQYIDELSKRKEAVFEIYVEIKGLINEYKAWCQKYIEKNKEKIIKIIGVKLNSNK